MNSNIKPILIGNAYGLDTHGGFGGDIFHQDGICRNLGASQGGGAAFTFVMIYEPMCLSYTRSGKSEGGQYYTRRHLSEAVNCLCPSRRETNEILIIEPHKTMEQAEPQAIGHYRPKGKTGDIPYSEFELRPKKDGIANTVTSQPGSKDALIAESIIISPFDRTPAHPNTEFTPTLRSNCHGAIPCVVSKQELLQSYETVIASTQEHAYKGSVDKISPCLTEAMGTSGTNTPMVTQRQIAYKKMPNGDIRAFQANSPSKAGVPEMMITNPNNEPPTVTTVQTPKIMEQQPYYRIRKLHPIETYRLMDLEDEDIHKLMDAKDAKGKPLIPKSKHYALAGNSIVTSCLYHIFRKMFIDTEPTEPVQLELFS